MGNYVYTPPAPAPYVGPQGGASDFAAGPYNGLGARRIGGGMGAYGYQGYGSSGGSGSGSGSISIPGQAAGNAGGNRYDSLYQNVLGQINGYDPTASINSAYDAQTALGLRDLGIQQEGFQAGHGLMPGDAHSQAIKAGLTSKLMADIGGGRAMALANAGQQKLGALSSLLPGAQNADQFQATQADKARQQQMDAVRWQWEQDAHNQQLQQMQQARSYAPQAQAQAAYAPAAQHQQSYAPAPSAYAPATNGVPSGWTGPVGSPQGFAGLTEGIGAEFGRGFGQSFYAPTGPGGQQNIMNTGLGQASNFSNGFRGVNQGTTAPQKSSYSPTTGNGPQATNAPTTGAKVTYAPPMSGISVAGPTSDLLQGQSYYPSFQGYASDYKRAAGYMA